jgi:hypothetical protein
MWKFVAMLRDIVRPRTAAHTAQSLCQLKHPLYNPDLAPTDDYLLGTVQDVSKDRHFASDQGVRRNGTCVSFHSTANIFSEGIQKVAGYCVEKSGTI